MPQLQVLGRLGKLHLQEMEYEDFIHSGLWCFPTKCTFQASRAARVGGLLSPRDVEIAVLDTLADTLPEGGGVVQCLRWMTWKSTFPVPVFDAMVVAVVDKDKNIYRRIGWMEVVREECFEEEESTIILV